MIGIGIGWMIFGLVYRGGGYGVGYEGWGELVVVVLLGLVGVGCR